MVHPRVFSARFCSIVALIALTGATALAQQDDQHGVSPAPASLSSTAAPAATPEAAAAMPSATPSPVLTGSSATPGALLSGTGGLPALTGTDAAMAAASPTPTPKPVSPYSVEIDLSKQRAHLLKDGKEIAVSPISSGRAGHLTPVGNFEVLEKDPNHLSTLYGKIVEKGSGRTVKSGADVATPVPKGCRFERAPMKFFMRFEGATGMHAGILPGYPASHGCVRMPAAKAKQFYGLVEIGTPVHVFGEIPEGRERSESHVSHVVRARPVMTPMPTPVPRRPWWHF